MAQIGTIIADKYEILTELGRGGMSVVYLAMDKNLNKQWAVKEVKKKAKNNKGEIAENSLLAEAEMMKRLDHPALPRIVDIIGKDDKNSDVIYVVMDYIEGQSLDKHLTEQGPQEEKKVVDWALQIGDALNYLHNQKPPIIYRDMKPSNVMLKPEGNIKIIDFGIAREYKENKQKDTAVLGTKGYAAPEQYVGQTDTRSDIYALGMTMHHLLTGVDPCRGTERIPVRQWNPELSEGIEIVINKCTQPAAENRYQNCKDLLWDLSHLDKITKKYKEKQRRKLMTFWASAGTAIFMLFLGIGCKVASVQMNNNTYDAKIEVMESTSLEEKIESYKEAIEIYPEDTRAYIKILEAYETGEGFSKAENDQYLALYNAHKGKFDRASTSFAELNYKSGMMYFNYYTEEDGTYSLGNRIQKAYAFFEMNYKNTEISPEFKQRSISDCYYHICSFYKKYILNSSNVEEASKQDYVDLFETIETALEDVQVAGAYDQLTLYNGVFMLLYDQRESMASVNFEQRKVLDMFEKVYREAIDLNVQKIQSELLQSEMRKNYVVYKEAIERVYTNKEERS